MKIVEFKGGLGNQMFQYAFYLKLKNVYEENVKADFSFFCKQNCHNGYELKRIFNIDMPFATVEECYFSGKKCIGEISHNRLLKFAYRIYYNAFLSKHMFPPHARLTIVKTVNIKLMDIMKICLMTYINIMVVIGRTNYILEIFRI